MSKPRSKTNLQQEQKAMLKELGSHLHQIRHEKGLEIEQIKAETKIGVRLLRAIETGDLETLPEPVYIRGLLKQYANYLGLNGTEFAAAFPVESSLGQRKFTLIWLLPSLQLRPFHLYIIYVLVLLFAVRGLSSFLENSTANLNSQPVIQPILVEQPTPVNSTSPPPATEQPLPVSDPKPAKPVVVEVQIKKQSWLRVSVDGTTQFEGLLATGTERTWTAEEQVTLLAGNAGGVVVTFNEGEAQLLGSSGEVQEVTYQAPPNAN